MTAISFEGRVAIITGAGGGIGRTHALELGRRGASVVVNDLGGGVDGRDGSPGPAEAVAREIRDAGGTAIANYDSVATTEGANALVAQALDAFGKLDVLINNAGIMRNGYLENLTDEDWDDVIATHLNGSFKVTRAAWPHFKARHYGRVVFTSSSAGMFGSPVLANYGAAKAGVAGLMHVAAIEGKEFGILCNAIMPNAHGRMAVRMMEDLGEAVESGTVALPPEMGNSMNPDFNAPLAVYLASEACTSTRALYSQCLGRIARVFVGVTSGWQAQRQSPPTVEEIAEHWNQIGDTALGFVTPESPRDQLRLVMTQADVRA
jgi:NAD(P)-dependent dehydrogenase (short-subunit alcohol dehydrogenase family)